MDDFTNSNMMQPFQASQSIAGPSSQRWATEAGWHKHQDTIKRLYLDDNKTLKDVMAIMVRDYGHRGTEKMYKRRITKWKLDKKTKEEEAWAILRIQIRRDLSGKTSAFRVRGKPVTMNDVFQYFKRKGVLHPDPSTQRLGAPTPPAVAYWTPSSTPRPDTTVDLEEAAENASVNDKDDANMSMATQLCSQSAEAGDFPQFIDFDHFWQFSLSLPVVSPHEIPESPLPPGKFLVMEKLFAEIMGYYDGAFGSGMFITNKNSDLALSNHGANNACLAEFYNLCTTGVRNMDVGMIVIGRRCFSKASSLLPFILNIRHPDSLAIIFRVLLLITRSSFDVAAIMLGFMLDLATQTPRHPWKQLLSHLHCLNESEVRNSLIEAWRCTCDRLVKFLGQFHKTALHLYSGFVLDGSQDPICSMQSLLKHGQSQLSITDPRLLSLRLDLAVALYQKNRHTEALDVQKNLLCVLGQSHEHLWLKGHTLTIMSNCQYDLGQTTEAVSNRQKAIKIVEHLTSRLNASTLGYKAILPKWLRELDREEEANALDAEMDEMIGPDIDLE